MSDSLSMALAGLRNAEQQAATAAIHLAHSNSSVQAEAENEALRSSAAASTGRTQMVDQAAVWSARAPEQQAVPAADAATDPVSDVVQLQQARNAYAASATMVSAEEKMTQQALSVLG
ncbi:hypothetical protein [Insolitispirillum peregrinum]|uniref:hypothetical protein n=1 Tax=Insolitispirillum peregrinum TaxID=80876 RepID=UPI00361222E8